MTEKDDGSIKIECGFQGVPCEYRGKGAVCEIDEAETNERCPAGE